MALRPLPGMVYYPSGNGILPFREWYITLLAKVNASSAHSLARAARQVPQVVKKAKIIVPATWPSGWPSSRLAKGQGKVSVYLDISKEIGCKLLFILLADAVLGFRGEKRTFATN